MLLSGLSSEFELIFGWNALIRLQSCRLFFAPDTHLCLESRKKSDRMCYVRKKHSRHDGCNLTLQVVRMLILPLDHSKIFYCVTWPLHVCECVCVWIYLRAPIDTACKGLEYHRYAYVPFWRHFYMITVFFTVGVQCCSSASCANTRMCTIYHIMVNEEIAVTRRRTTTNE